jgi:hypothetical protein
MLRTGISLEMAAWLSRASGAWRQYYSFDWIILVLDVEGVLCTYNPLHLGCNRYGISTHPNRRSGYLLPSQQLTLEDHATSDISLVRTFPLRRFFAFRVLSGGQQSTEVVESCCGVAPHTLYAGRVTSSLKNTNTNYVKLAKNNFSQKVIRCTLKYIGTLSISRNCELK